ncbi:hypothetical protein [Weissella cibaria]|uniref:Uncharacterized protein n=1 Tax=Weissella cibaria TaxID=137591 RepID=A0A2S1KTG7_9LACO|nr:hypothetical protein [Weissella cibaria]AWF96270.1 hypothetical protein B6254_1908 [Weissella cibaria]
MKKLVLASLLSVSVLGATSAAFASNTADTTTPSVASNLRQHQQRRMQVYQLRMVI